MDIGYTQQYRKEFEDKDIEDQLANVNKYIEEEWDLLVNKDLDSLYDRCPLWCLNGITHQLINCGIDPLEYINTIYENSYRGLTIKNIKLPNRIKYIQSDAFMASDIETIDLGVVEKIEDFAFTNCRKLKIITIPDSVKIIQANVFFRCLNLTEVRIPKKLGFTDREISSLFDSDFSSYEDVFAQYKFVKIIEY